jgi:hypothetical protein
MSKLLWDIREEQALMEKLRAADPTGKWISDFVHSDNPKFAGKSKKERIRMALGASYAAKRQTEEVDIDEAAWGQDKMANLKAAHDRHSEKAIAANRAGDHEAVKVHQSKMNMIKTQMNKLRKEEKELGEAVHRIGLTVTDPNHPMVSKRKETIQKTVRVTSDDREKAIKSAIAHHKRKGYKVHDHHYIGTVNEEVEQIDEVGDTNKGQKLLRQVNKRAVDRLVSKRADTDPAYAKKAQQTHLAADSRLKEAKDSREYDYEGDMAKSQLRSIIANAQQVHDMLDDNTNMAEWVQSKITLAADYITTVADYMQSEVKEEVAQVDELRTSTMLRYATKANKSLIGGDRNKEEKRIKGIQKANYKIQTRHSVKEDTEQVDETPAYTKDDAYSSFGSIKPHRTLKIANVLKPEKDASARAERLMSKAGVRTNEAKSLYDRHQEIRKKSGLPDPSYYLKRMKEKQAEIEALRNQGSTDHLHGISHDAHPGAQKTFAGQVKK